MRFAISLLLIGCTALAQDLSPAFEVASVKLNRTNPPGSSTHTGNGRFTAENASLRSLIVRAYDLRDTQLLGGPAWVSTDHWDVNARPEAPVPAGPAGDKLLRSMLRSLLATRFQLEMHQEQRQLPVYSLTVAKGGPKLIASPSDTTNHTSSGPGMLKTGGTPLSDLARSLGDQLSRTVFDETGIAGNFDITLEFAPVSGKPLLLNGQEVDRPDIFTALQQQLGLKLESRKAPVDVMVIDKAERATEN